MKKELSCITSFVIVVLFFTSCVLEKELLLKKVQNTYTLDYIEENCRVIVTPQKNSYNEGETIQLDAYPQPGYYFSHWEGSGLSQAQPYHTITFQITSNIIVKGICSENTLKMTWINTNKPGMTDKSVLTEYTGTNATSSDGQLFENLIIRKRINVNHANVTFRNCLMAYNPADKIAIFATRPGERSPQGGVNLTIQNCELISGIHTRESFTVKNCYMHAEPGYFRNDGLCFEADNVLIEGNLIDNLNGSTGAHLDGIQIMKGNNITIRNNWIEAFSHHDIPGAGAGIAGVIMVKPDLGNITNLTIEGNMLLQDPLYGYFPLRIYNVKDNNGVLLYSTSGNIIITNNLWDINQKGLSAPYQITKEISITTWDNNKYTNGTVINLTQ